MNVQKASLDSVSAIFRSSFNQMNSQGAQWFLLGAIDIAIPTILKMAIPYLGIILQSIATSFLFIGLFFIARETESGSSIQITKIFSAFSLFPERVFRGFFLQLLWFLLAMFVFALILALVVFFFQDEFAINPVTHFSSLGFSLQSFQEYFSQLSSFEISFYVLLIPLLGTFLFSVMYIATFFTSTLIYFENLSMGDATRVCLEAWKKNFWGLNIYLLASCAVAILLFLTIIGICFLPSYSAISFQKLYSLIFVKSVEPSVIESST